MQKWNEISNLRTTLLHLQVLYASLKEDIKIQQHKIIHAHRDRFIQYYQIQKQCRILQMSNMQTIFIVKLQQCISLYEQIDDKLWPKLGNFLKYVELHEQNMRHHITKIYLGAQCMINLPKCEEQLSIICDQMSEFIHRNQQSIQNYNKKIQKLEQIQLTCEQYSTQMMHYIEEIKTKYPNYLQNKLKSIEEQTEKSISYLKKILLQ